MTNKYIKWCSPPLVIREMQIKTTARCHFTPTSLAIIKKTYNTCGRGCVETRASYAAAGNTKWCSHFGKQSGCPVPQRVKYRVTILLNNYAPRYTHPREMKTYDHTNLYVNVQNSIIYNDQKMSTWWYPIYLFFSLHQDLLTLWELAHLPQYTGISPLRLWYHPNRPHRGKWMKPLSLGQMKMISQIMNQMSR